MLLTPQARPFPYAVILRPAASSLLYTHLLRGLDEAAAWYEKAIAQRDARAPWITAALFGDGLTSGPLAGA